MAAISASPLAACKMQVPCSLCSASTSDLVSQSALFTVPGAEEGQGLPATMERVNSCATVVQVQRSWLPPQGSGRHPAQAGAANRPAQVQTPVRGPRHR
jgi:hypothetical protein